MSSFLEANPTLPEHNYRLKETWSIDHDHDLRFIDRDGFSYCIFSPDSMWPYVASMRTDPMAYVAVSDKPHMTQWRKVAEANTLDLCYATAQLLNWEPQE